jgi:hypothetical protein
MQIRKLNADIKNVELDKYAFKTMKAKDYTEDHRIR